MPCFKPLKGYRSKDPKDKRIKFNIKEGYYDQPLDVPCGKCIGCMERYSKEWAIRSMHEAQTSYSSCFLTLTYDDENYPEDNSIRKEVLSYFMKDLRKKVNPIPIRFFGCGEYGSTGGRAHYHVIIFNYDFFPFLRNL